MSQYDDDQVIEDEVPFQVGEEVEVGDISDVQQSLLPAVKNVHAVIRKSASKASEDGALKSLKVELVLPDGILVDNPETGEQEALYINKVIFPGFMDLCFWADKEKKTSQWFKDRQHLLGFKEFCSALKMDLSKIKVNDEFHEAIKGRDILVSIKHEANSAINPTTNKREKDGTFREKYYGWKEYKSDDAQDPNS